MGFNFWHWGFYSGSHWRWSMCIVQNTHLLAEGEQACWMYRSCQPSHAGTAQDVRGQDPRLYLGSPPTGLPQRALKLDTAHSGLTRLATSVWFSFWSCDQLYVLGDVKEQSFKKNKKLSLVVMWVKYVSSRPNSPLFGGGAWLCGHSFCLTNCRYLCLTCSINRTGIKAVLSSLVPCLEGRWELLYWFRNSLFSFFG